MSDAMEQRLNLQPVRMDAMHESVQQAQETATENSATLHDMLVGIKNLAETVKQMREEIRGWEEPAVQEEME